MMRRPDGQNADGVVRAEVLIACVMCSLLLFSGCSNGGDGESGSVHNRGQHPLPTYDDKPSLSSFFVAYENPVEPQVSGYALPLHLDRVENYGYMNTLFDLEAVGPMLAGNGFAILEYTFGAPWIDEQNDDDMVVPYALLRKMDVPIFVSADTLLHLYHVQFDETLKDLEEREFSGDIRDLTEVLLAEALVQHERHEGDLREAARRNVAYLAVAAHLIDPDSQIPELVRGPVEGEVGKIRAHAGFAPSDIFVYEEDYSQYVPRGHYTRSERLERYFRTLMWYGRIAFLLKGAENWGAGGDALIRLYDARIQTLQAVLLALSLNSVQVEERTGRAIWDRIYAVTSFYVGLADDLTPYEYLGAINEVFVNGFAVTDLEDEDNFFALKTELGLLRSPEIFGGTGNAMVTPPVTPGALDEVLAKTKGMRFMGQRFVPDSYMFQHLVFPEVLDYTGSGEPEPFTYGLTGVRGARCYPRGLDVMSILGSERAREILIAEGDTEYVDYDRKYGELRTEFDELGVSEWTRNLYWGWLYALRALIGGFGEGYPSFMRTEAWDKKSLNAALASWTELRHDTILYAKQSLTPGETSIPPEVTGYVEPVPEFYGRLLALTRMTREGLADFAVLSTDAEQRMLALEEILLRLIQIASMELTNQALSEDDHAFIRTFAAQLENVILGVGDEGLRTTLVADVHTHGVEGKVVEEAVGNVDLIVVACPGPDDAVFLAAGPVLSYYEFKHPMNDRLTDEAWRELLASPGRPERPPWFRPLVKGP